MKQPKKLSLKQKKLVASAGLNPMNYMCHFEDDFYLHIIEKATKKCEIVDKQKGELVSHEH